MMTIINGYATMTTVIVIAMTMIMNTAFVTALDDTTGTDTDNPECRLYLAPSSLSEEGKTAIFGLFAGPSGFQKDEVIPSHEIAIPIFDFLKSPVADRSELHTKVIQYIEQSCWIADYGGTSKFEGNHSISVFIPGIGSLTNYHSGIANVDWDQASLLLRTPDDTVTSQMGHPHINRGTITPYYNATIKATMWIQPGMELFAHYGATEDTTETNQYYDTVTRWDYEKADKMIDKMIQYFDTYGSKMSDSLKDDTIDFMLETILGGADGLHAKVVRSLIPTQLKKLYKAKEVGGSFAYRNKDLIKSQSWLQQHGLCVDNLMVGKSTIDDAGRGAFARRNIPKDAVISPVPMLPILNEEVLEQYSITTEVLDKKNRSKWVLDKNASSTGYHLLLNYAYGHMESTLMLVPLAPMVNYINHANHPSQINAYLQWSKHDDIYNDHNLHDLEVERIRTTNPRRVTMELVALKDIKIGDEILINYNSDWAEAYNIYKDEWKAIHPDPMNEKYPYKALELRSLYTNKPYPVNIQEGQTPYPDGVITGCFIDSVEDLPDGHIKYNHKNYQVLKFGGPKVWSEFMGQNLNICDLIDRVEYIDDVSKTIQYNYTVYTRKNSKDVDPTIIEVRDVPHTAITFIDKPYTGDIHLPNAFRRWISIDDQRFPQSWRNARSY